MKKAITPVISVILLIMLTVAITGGAWYWMTNVQGSLQEGAGSSIEQTTDLSSTQFSIVSVICKTSGAVNVTVLNTGSNAIASTETWVLTLSSITGATLGSNITASAGADNGDIAEVAAGAAQVVRADSGLGTIASGTSYSVKVSVGGGSQTATCTGSA